MADITSLTQGNTEKSGKVNWRGDQVTTHPQSIYETSSVRLNDLGARKVVGDRVFRYTLAAGAVGAGDYANGATASVLNVTAGDTDPAGAFTFTWYSATAVAKNYWAEGYIHAQSGTAANLGYMYRIKSHAAIATTSNGTLTLYDPLVKALNVADKWSIRKNIYDGVLEGTAGTAGPAGVAPILVTSGDYFWLQTWGPAAVKNAAGAAAGMSVVPDATGQVIGLVQSNTVNAKSIVGWNMQIYTASQYGATFLTIAP